MTSKQLIQQVRAYWEALCDGRQVPLRAEVDPRGIERALDHAFILERIAPSIARFRLAGSHVNDLIGMEVRGMPLTALFTPRSRPGLAQRLETAFQTPGVLELDLVGESGFAKPALSAKMILLPLASDLGDVSRALGCLVAEGGVGRTPRRFEVRSARLTARYADGHCEEMGDVLVPPRSLVAPDGLSEPAAHYVPPAPAPVSAAPVASEPLRSRPVESLQRSPETPESRRALFRLVKSDG